MVLCDLIVDLFVCLLTPTCNASGSAEITGGQTSLIEQQQSRVNGEVQHAH